MKVLVVGIGQSLRGDDAAGLEAVRAWQQHFPHTASWPGVAVEFLESSGIELVSLLERADAALLVDAVRSGASAGHVHHLTVDDIAELSGAAGPMHGWGIPEALQMASALGLRPQGDKIRLLGIESAQEAIGAGLSPAVHESLPAATAAIEKEVLALLAE